MSALAPTPVEVRGPYADELQIGQVFTDAPPVTLTDGLAALHRSIVGNRIRLSLDHALSTAVTGRRVVSPALVWDISIGQSTAVTQHVRANLFYRGLGFRRLPALGDTLTTVTTVGGLRETSRKPGRRPTGLVALNIVTTDQHERPVLDYWRCAMIPLSGDDAALDRQDDLSALGLSPSYDDMAGAVEGWDLAAYRRRIEGPHFDALHVGDSWQVVGGDVVSGAPELARMTGNLAQVHHDAPAAGGQRLVYGGHTIGLALHQASRALPTMVTVAGWDSCDHVGPVHEGDTLRSTVTVTGIQPLQEGGGLVHLQSLVDSHGTERDARPVLDWRFTAVLA